jgi:DNA-binding LacI/PurR family transcriptional regulator
VAGRLARIAEQAGVSQATVSRVLNDKPGIARQTRGAVIAAMDVLGIERPPVLQARDIGLVGIVLPELDNPIFPRLARAIEGRLAERSYTPVIGQQGVGNIHEDDYVHALVAHGARGLIFVSGIHALEGADPGRYRTLLEHGLPFVLVNGSISGLEVASYSVDDAEAVHLAVDHLWGLGHRRIGLGMGEPRYQPVVRRTRAFHEAMTQRLGRGTPNHLVQCTDYTIDGGAAAARALIDRGATAIVCGSDLMAIGAISAAETAGLHVPHDVSVVGSDDSTLMSHLKPGLTTVRVPAEAMGTAAADALINRLAGLPVRSGERLFTPELVVRASTAPVRASGPRPQGASTYSSEVQQRPRS